MLSFHIVQLLLKVSQKYSRVYTPSNKALEPSDTYFSVACLYETSLPLLREQSLGRILVLCCQLPSTRGGGDGMLYSRSEIQFKVCCRAGGVYE